MAEAFEGRPMNGTIGELLQELDDNAAGCIAVPFPGLNATVWIEVSVDDGYHVVIVCEGDENHEPHVGIEYPLLSAGEVAQILFVSQERQDAKQSAYNSLN